MTSKPKNVQVHKLENILDKYSITFHSTIKMKPADVTSCRYIDFDVENNYKDPKFNVSDCNWTRTQNHLVLKQTLNHLSLKLVIM